MKFTPGPAIASASGSIGGTTFSHNRFGAYTRKRSIPTDPNTNRQQAVKSNFGTLSTHWHTQLTEVERAGWNEYGANVPRIDSLGQTHYLPGIQWFIGANTLLLQAGFPLLTDAPTVFNRTEVPALKNVASFQTQPANPNTGSYLNLNDGAPVLNLLFDRAIPLGEDLFISFGRPQNSTINFYKAPWRFWGSDAGTGGAQFSINSTEANQFPWTYTVGQAVFVRLRVMSFDGRYSPAGLYRLPVWDVSE